MLRLRLWRQRLTPPLSVSLSGLQDLKVLKGLQVLMVLMECKVLQVQLVPQVQLVQQLIMPVPLVGTQSPLRTETTPQTE